MQPIILQEVVMGQKSGAKKIGRYKSKAVGKKKGGGDSSALELHFDPQAPTNARPVRSRGLFFKFFAFLMLTGILLFFGALIGTEIMVVLQQ